VDWARARQQAQLTVQEKHISQTVVASQASSTPRTAGPCKSKRRPQCMPENRSREGRLKTDFSRPSSGGGLTSAISARAGMGWAERVSAGWAGDLSISRSRHANCPGIVLRRRKLLGRECALMLPPAFGAYRRSVSRIGDIQHVPFELADRKSA